MLDNSSFHTTLQITIHLNEQIFYTYLYNSCLYKLITSLNCYSLFSNKDRQTNKKTKTNIDLGFEKREIDAGVFWHNYIKNKQKQPCCKMSTAIW